SLLSPATFLILSKDKSLISETKIFSFRLTFPDFPEDDRWTVCQIPLQHLVDFYCWIARQANESENSDVSSGYERLFDGLDECIRRAGFHDIDCLIALIDGHMRKQQRI